MGELSVVLFRPKQQCEHCRDEISTMCLSFELPEILND